VNTIIDRFLEEADRLDSLGDKASADRVDKAVKLATSGQHARAYLSLAAVAAKNEVVASLIGDLWSAASGGDIKALQNAALAASRLRSVSMAPTHAPNQRVIAAFDALESAMNRLPSVFTSQIAPIVDSIRGDVAGVLSPAASQNITNAAGKIVEALSPNKLLEYKRGLPMTTDAPTSKPEDNKEKAILDAIKVLRESVPEERIPKLLTTLKMTSSEAEAMAFLKKAPPPVKPTTPPAPVEPEKVAPAPEEKKPEKIISPITPEPTPAPVTPTVETTQYPTLKGVNGAIGLFDHAIDTYLITLVSSVSMDPEKMVELMDEIKGNFSRFLADRLSNTKSTSPMSAPALGKEAERIVKEFLSQEGLVKDVPEKILAKFSKTVGESVKLEAPMEPTSGA